MILRDTAVNRIRKGLLSGYPLFYLQGDEENRLVHLLADLAREHYGNDDAFIQWSATQGFHTRSGPVEAILDPIAALQYVAASGRRAFFLMKDMPALFADHPLLTRALRDLYHDLADTGTHLFLSYPDFKLTEELKKQVFLVTLEMPSEREILDHLRTLVGREKLSPEEDWLLQCAAAMRGMTLQEVNHLMTRLVRERKLEIEAALPEIIEEKSYALLKEGCLEYVAKRVDLDQVGGLDNLKEWVASRKSLFSRHAFESGIPLPAGILFMGVSGCGKSMAAKVVASAWNLPLVRLDMNLVLSGAYGAPEYAFDHALKVAEGIAPLVLWIDEMENSFGYDLRSGGGNNNIFASFLTWMQEKPPTVFVVATANRIEKLPAEVIRKGRFDQLFFLDLPTEEERKAIIGIHIKALGGDPAAFNLNLLVAVTKNWSGAEIEQVIKAARVRGYQENRMFNDNDIVWNTARMVPLSRTMEEQIKQLRLWSINRATPASKKAEG